MNGRRRSEASKGDKAIAIVIIEGKRVRRRMKEE